MQLFFEASFFCDLFYLNKGCDKLKSASCKYGCYDFKSLERNPNKIRVKEDFWIKVFTLQSFIHLNKDGHSSPVVLSLCLPRIIPFAKGHIN